MNVSYSTLFTIDLLHEYFLDGKCRGLEIVPTTECASICKKMNIQVRSYENRLSAFIRENDLHQPFVSAGGNKSYHESYDTTVLRFYIKLTNPEFFNYTNIEYNFNDNKILYFSNLANNEVNGVLNITTPVKDYVAGSTYVPGNLVKDPASGNVYECIKKNVAAALNKKKNPLVDLTIWVPKGLLYLQKPVEEFAEGKYYKQGDIVIKPGTTNVYQSVNKQTAKKITDLDDASLWMSRGQGELQYVTESDSITCCGDNYVFKTSNPVSTATIDIFKYNYDDDNPGYTVEAMPQQQLKFKTPVTTVPINVAALSAGVYMVKLNKETAIVYHDPILNKGKIIGVVEIFNYLAANKSYSLLDGEEKIKGISYKLQFANRRILWKYVRKDSKAKHITDTGETKYVFNLNGEDFISAVPIPLTQDAVKTLKLEFNTKDFDLQPLPNPQIERLRKFTQDDYDYYCGEVYLNY